MEQAMKRTWAEIDLGNLEHNYHTLRAMLPYGCKFVGVVKANAYGHGAVPVAKKLEELGADYLAVACLDEGEELRQAGVSMPILVLGVTPEEYLDEVIRLELTQSVTDPAAARACSDAAVRLGKTMKIHLKADTGMTRLGWFCGSGAGMARTVEEMARAAALPGLEAEGIFTHFANADGDEAYTMAQFERFLELIGRLEEQGVRFPIRHCAASAAVLHYPCTHLDMVRPGLVLYGHYPDPDSEGLDGPGLLPVMSLKTRVAEVRTIPAGTAVSYGCTAILKEETTLAVLPIGYADGLDRSRSNVGQVWLNGEFCPIVGRVCMDMCMVAVKGAVKPGDVATIYGDRVPVEEAAEQAGTIPYELLCAVSPRVPRLYR